jgi:predicted  nucleic acid-binding Zn-ribbon protein
MKLHKALNRMREMHEAYNHASTEDSKRLAAWRDEVIALRDERDRLAIRVAALEQQVENLENVILEMGEY